MDKVLLRKGIRMLEEKYCLDDITEKLIKSTSSQNFMSRIKKTKVNGLHYITKEQAINIIQTSRSAECKETIKLIEKTIGKASKKQKQKPKICITEDEPIKQNNMDTNLLTTNIDTNNQILTFSDHIINYITTDDDIWFKGKEIALLLGYKDTRSAIQDNVNNDDKVKYEFLLNSGRGSQPLHALENKQSTSVCNNVEYTALKNLKSPVSEVSHNDKITIYINESGLYSLIMRSTLPNAREFQQWVTKEVLPSIRKTGQYNAKTTQRLPQIAYDMHALIGKNCLYIMHVKDNLYKYGITLNMKKRKSAHERHLKCKKVIRIYDIKDHLSNKKLEVSLGETLQSLNVRKFYNSKSGEIRNKKWTEESCTIGREFFETNEEYDLIFITNLIENAVKTCNDETDMSDHKFIEQSKTKQLEITLEIKKQETESDKHKLELIKQQSELIKQGVSPELVFSQQKSPEPSPIQLPSQVIPSSQALSQDPKPPSIPTTLSKSKPKTPYTKSCPDCDTKIRDRSIRCNICTNKRRFVTNSQNSKRPSYNQLKKDKETMNRVQMGKKYGVSDNAVKKWFQSYEKYEGK